MSRRPPKTKQLVNSTYILHDTRVDGILLRDLHWTPLEGPGCWQDFLLLTPASTDPRKPLPLLLKATKARTEHFRDTRQSQTAA